MSTLISDSSKRFLPWIRNALEKKLSNLRPKSLRFTIRATGCATRLSLSGGRRSAIPPVLLELAIAVQGAKMEDRLGPWIEPAHAGLFESLLDNLASGRCDLPRANRQMMPQRPWVVESFAIS